MSSKDTPIYNALKKAIKDEVPVALATIVEGENTGAKLLVFSTKTLGSLGNPDLDRVVTADTLGHLDAGKTGSLHYSGQGERKDTTISVFIESFSKRPQMIIFGAVDFTATLVKLAGFMGYRVTVCDARAIFATKERFPTADEIFVGWPDEIFDKVEGELTARDVVCILTHDSKFDVPAIMRALKTEVYYIGVMGSRKTHTNRIDRLKEAGASKKDIDRLKAPIGLDIGSSTPEETAISILAEITATRHNRMGVPLKDTTGSIH